MREELWRVFAQKDGKYPHRAFNIQCFRKPWLKSINNEKLDVNVELTLVFNLCRDDHHLFGKLESLSPEEMFKACQRAPLPRGVSVCLPFPFPAVSCVLWLSSYEAPRRQSWVWFLPVLLVPSGGLATESFSIPGCWTMAPPHTFSHLSEPSTVSHRVFILRLASFHCNTIIMLAERPPWIYADWDLPTSWSPLPLPV